MARCSRRRVHITQRDKDLFEYLFLQKVATATQVRLDIFGTQNHDAVVRRLKSLVDGGYLKRFNTETSRLRLAYGLSDLAFNKYLSSRLERSWKQLKSESVQHDIALVDIRRRLQRSRKVLKIVTENGLESSFDCPAGLPLQPFIEMHSDAAIIFKNYGKTFNVALEFENSSQNRTHYEKHFRGYHLRHQVHAVIYIVRETSWVLRLAEIERACSQSEQSKIFFGTLEQVLNLSAPLYFKNSTGEILKFE